MIDFTVQNEGGIFLLHPHTDAATAWISDNLDPDHQMFGRAVVAEHRYIAAIVREIQSAGLEVR